MCRFRKDPLHTSLRYLISLFDAQHPAFALVTSTQLLVDFRSDCVPPLTHSFALLGPLVSSTFVEFTKFPNNSISSLVLRTTRQTTQNMAPSKPFGRGYLLAFFLTSCFFSLLVHGLGPSGDQGSDQLLRKRADHDEAYEYKPLAVCTQSQSILDISNPPSRPW